jgi:hypothetical protein
LKQKSAINTESSLSKPALPLLKDKGGSHA